MCRGPLPTARYLPGDGIEQNDQRWLYGARGRYSHLWSAGPVPLESRFELETRNDQIHVALRREHQREAFFTVNQVVVDERTLAGYLEEQLFFTDWIRASIGVRGDVYFIRALNDLPAERPDPNFDAVPIRGRTTDGILSPKANLVVTPLPSTDLFVDFGEGFHSNDAREALLARGAAAGTSTTPLTRSIGAELGVRTRQLERLDVSVAGWWLDLDSELVFSGDAGTFEPAGKTRRFGADFESRYRVTRWLSADYDLAYAHATFTDGAAVPLAPTLLMDGDLTADLGHGFSTGLRLRFLDDRPATEDRRLTARGYTLLDLLARYGWRNVEATLALLNVTDTDWREAQFADRTCVRGEVGRPACAARPGKQLAHPLQPAPDIHFTPGNPFGVRAGLAFYF